MSTDEVKKLIVDGDIWMQDKDGEISKIAEIQNFESVQENNQDDAADAVRKENISQIGIDANTKLPINLDEIAKQITSQFGIDINLDEGLNKTATQLQQEYNNKYLGRWTL